MFFTIEKFQKRVEELGQRRYFGWKAITPFTAAPGNLPKDAHYSSAPEKIEGEVFTQGDCFIGRDRYLWLEKQVMLPEKKEGCKVVGFFDFGETGDGNNSGFESLLYLNGHPYQGVDTNHKEVFFSGKEGENVKITFLLWTGLEGGGTHRTFYHRCKKAEVGYLHKNTDALYYFAKGITETLQLLSEEDETYLALKAALDRALLYIDWDEEGFYPSVDQAYEGLMHALSRIEKHTDITVHAIGHTHIDVAWLWRLKHTREKAQRSFSTVLRLMDEFDDYVFLQSQPQLYQYIKEDCPELYERIREKVKEGRWEPDGGMWVEADCNIPSGESLVRQFLHGTRFFENEFGKKCEYLWLPDVFGYSWALPQILKLCEIDTFMTTKISWNQFNSIPNDLFWWRGIDGTEILTYFVNTPDEGRKITDRFSTYNGYMNPRAVLGSWKKFRNKDISRDTLVSYGYGDGGGGVNREMLEMRRVMDKIPGLPHVKTGKAGDFFRNLHQYVEETDRYVHTWDGELYLEYHRGTYTSQGYNKKMNRYMENKLIQTEWLSSMAYLSGEKYQQKELHDIWECVLLHQFHDIIPGSSIHEVYEDSRVNYEKASHQLHQVKKDVLNTMVEKEENHFGIYTANSFGGKELVHIPVRKKGYFVDEEGNILEAAMAGDGYDVLIDLQPLTKVMITFVPEKEQMAARAVEKADSFLFESDSLETPLYSIAWNEEGQLVRLYDKVAGRSVLKDGEKGNVLEVYEDKPLDFDAWDIDIFYTQKMETMHICEPVRLVEKNDLKAVIRFVYRYRNSCVTQDMIVYRDSKRIDFKTVVDWKESHRLLKTAFYTDIRAVKATYDIQYGHVERPTHWNTSWDWARFEVCGHKWADLSETGYGVSLLNDCKYGYSIKDHAIKLSLLKSAKNPDLKADMGEHTFTYALFAHEGMVTESSVIEEANRFNMPADVVQGKWKDQRKIVTINNSCIQIDAVKKAEDEECLIVRMHECKGGRGTVTVSSEYPVCKIVPCNLLEHDCGEAILGNEMEITYHPFQIITLKLYV